MPASFDKLDAYRLAIEFVGMLHPVIARLRRTDATLADQLHRASTSIALNIAEGAGEFSMPDKAKFYRYALRSATESVAALDVLSKLGRLSDAEHRTIREPAIRLVSMCTRLVISTRGRTPDAEPGVPPRREDRDSGREQEQP